MNGCPPREELQRLLEGNPDDPTVKAFGVHLEGCAECRRALGELTVAGATRLTRVAPPPREAGVRRLGRYHVLKKLGQGGMGNVYLGHDRDLDRKLALKVMLPQYAADAEARARFLREARAAAMVNSVHVVTIFDVDDNGGLPFIAMEYLLGCPLDQYLKTKGELPLAQALRVVREAAIGLAAAHELGLVHRDVKPANLWLEAPTGRVKLLDFGLARETTDANLTGTGAVIGTPSYMSPEQARGQKVDGRGDLFSLGVVLYRLTTGRMPFTGNGVMAVLTSLALDTPIPPRQLKPGLPAVVEAVITRLLEKDPDERFQTAGELIAALADLEQPTASSPTPEAEAEPNPADTQIPNVWEGIDDSATVQGAAAEVQPADEPTPLPKRVRKPRATPGLRVPKWLLGLAAGVFVIPLAAALLWPTHGTLVVDSEDPDAELVIRKDGRVVHDRTREREFRLPTGAYTLELADATRARLDRDRVELTYNGTSRVRVERPRPQPQFPPPPPEKPPERKAAEYALSVGGSVRVNGSETDVRNEAALPAERFALTAAALTGPRVTDAGLANFKGCTRLTHLQLNGTAVTDAGLAHFRECPELVQLILGGTKVTSSGLAVFNGCTHLTHLELNGTRVTDAGLAPFGECINLQRLDLSDTEVGDAGLARLAGCKGLASLLLKGTKVGDGALATLVGFKSLTFLDLRGTKVTPAKLEAIRYALLQCRIVHDGGTIEPTVTSASDRKAAEYVFSIGGSVMVNGSAAPVKAAAGLPDRFVLTGVDLYANQKVTEAGLSVFAGCTSLTRVQLASSAVTDSGLAHFRNNTRLQELSLHLTKVTDAGLKHFKDCKELTTLAFSHLSGVTDVGLATFKGCTKLISFDLDHTQVTDAGLANFAGNTIATRLNFVGLKGVTDKGLANFKGCTKLYLLWLGSTQVTDAGLANFKGCTTLYYLSVDSPKVTDAGLVNFKDSANLGHLQLDSTGVTDTGLGYFKASRQLVALSLRETQVGDAGLAHFKGVTTLTVLYLNGTKVTDAGLESFKGCKRLDSLWLNNTRTGDAGLAHFEGCNRLTYLQLNGTQVTDAGLRVFAGITTLRHLYLNDTRVGDEGLENFKDCASLLTLTLQKTRVSTGLHGVLPLRHPRCTIYLDGRTILPSK
jgi:serine/threonine protein kinase